MPLQNMFLSILFGVFTDRAVRILNKLRFDIEKDDNFFFVKPLTLYVK